MKIDKKFTYYLHTHVNGRDTTKNDNQGKLESMTDKDAAKVKILDFVSILPMKELNRLVEKDNRFQSSNRIPITSIDGLEERRKLIEKLENLEAIIWDRDANELWTILNESCFEQLKIVVLVEQMRLQSGSKAGRKRKSEVSDDGDSQSSNNVDNDVFLRIDYFVGEDLNKSESNGVSVSNVDGDSEIWSS